MAWSKGVFQNYYLRLLDHGQRAWTQLESIFAAVRVTPSMTTVVSKGTVDGK